MASTRVFSAVVYGCIWPKTQFCHFATDRGKSRIFEKRKWHPWVTWHGSKAFFAILMFHSLSKGSFRPWLRAKVGPKPSFAIFAMERWVPSVFRKSKGIPWVTWHERRTIFTISITGTEDSKHFMISPRVFLAVIWGKRWPKTQFAIFAIERRLSRVLGKSNRSPRPTWHGSSALFVMSVAGTKARQGYLTLSRVSLAEK